MLPTLLTLAALLSAPTLAFDALPVLDGAPLKTGQASPEDAAVVIGVEDYLRVADVPGAVADAKLVRDFLVYTRGVSPGRVRLLTAGASREVILGALQDMAHQVGAGGTLWFYFAGHGGASPDGERLLLGDDVPTAPEALRARSVTVSEIRKVGKTGAGQLMMVIDACYNGGTRQGGSVLEGGTRFVVPSAAIQQVKGIAEWNAAGPDQLARPLPGTGHGAFTYFWVGAGRGWADGQLDGKKDGVITAEESHEFITESLGAMGITAQTPQLTTDSASAWKLVKGAKEPAPDLRSREVVPEPPPVRAPVASVSTRGTDFAAMAAEAARADAEARAAAERADSMKKTLESERSKRTDAARTALLDQATKDWTAVKGVLKGGGSATRRVVETYLSTYGEATVSVDDTVIVVPVPQVTEARAWLEEADRATLAAAAPKSAPTAGARIFAPIPAGTTVRLDALSPEDAYYSSSDEMVGLTCTVTTDTNHNGEGWHGGPASCGGGDYYFYKAALIPMAGAAATPPKAAPRATTSTGGALTYDLPADVEVRITEISPEDAYYPGKEMIGLICTTGQGMSHNGGGFHGGPMVCDDGGAYYFYKAALVAADSSVATGTASGSAQDLGDKVANGTGVTIVDIHADDAYVGSKGSYIGLNCTVSGDLHRNDGLWYGGGMDCPGGSMYFYKVQVARGSAAPAATKAPAPAAPVSSAGRASGPVAKGAKVKLVDLSSEDAYYADKAGIVGKSCTATDALTDHGGGWYGGPIACEDGSDYYFYKVGISTGAASAPATAGARDLTASVPAGTPVVIKDISSEDAYYADRSGIIGKTCAPGEASTYYTGGWHGGPFACTDGSSYYFYKAALTSVGGGASAGTAGQDLGEKVADGTRVTIRDLRTGDLYYDNRGDYIGQACTVKGDLHRNDGLFYGGGLTCGGQYWYFAYVSVSRR